MATLKILNVLITSKVYFSLISNSISSNPSVRPLLRTCFLPLSVRVVFSSTSYEGDNLYCMDCFVCSFTHQNFGRWIRVVTYHCVIPYWVVPHCRRYYCTTTCLFHSPVVIHQSCLQLLAVMDKGAMNIYVPGFLKEIFKKILYLNNLYTQCRLKFLTPSSRFTRSTEVPLTY